VTRQECINRLHEWRSNPKLLDTDDGLSTPIEVIDRAIALLGECAETPTNIVPDGDGGIAFRFCYGRNIELLRDGRRYDYRFEDGKIISKMHEAAANIDGT
jgi:hypothetical protein